MKNRIDSAGNLILDFSPYTLIVSDKVQKEIDNKKRMLKEASYLWIKEKDEQRFSRQLQETVINKIFTVELLLDLSKDAEEF